MRSGEALLAIINDILDFSKVEAGKLAIEKSAADLPTLIREVMDAVEPDALRKGLRLELKLAPELPPRILTDGLRVKQVLLNLLSNAIKFTADGRVELRAARSDSGDAAWLRFEVIDSGIGIPREQAPALFQPFTQVDGQTTRRYGGTGLGLAICKRLAELMGGRLGFESRVGQGSTFWCELPLLPVAPVIALASSERPPAAVSASTAATSTPLHADARILAVDDNEINRVVIEEMAGELGRAIEVVESGREAVLRVSSGEPFALVLMDCQMPDIDGYMAAREIRAWEARTHARRTPIVAVTAHALDGELEKVRAAGMDDYLSKPLDLATLKQMLEKWLARSAA
jgi:CheY-like chemotaxis protein